MYVIQTCDSFTFFPIKYKGLAYFFNDLAKLLEELISFEAVCSGFLKLS